MTDDRFKNLRALAAPEPARSVEEALALLDPLPEHPPTEAVREVLGRFREVLRPMDDLSRELARDGAIQKLRLLGFKSAGRIVDMAMPLGRSGADSRAGVLAFQEPDLWPQAVEGAALLDQIDQTVRRFVALTAEQAVLFALWALFAHAHEAFEISPILAITSPDKGCGKSTALALLSALVPKPLTSANITPSAVFRVADTFRPTLLLDEADTFLMDSEGLRGILNSGHMRSQAYVTRVVGEDYRVCTFSTWAPKAVALIGELPATLADRSVTLRMRRRAPYESIERLQLHRLGEMEELRSMAARWASDHLDELRFSNPEIPEGIMKDRARDNWRSLLSIADLAGGAWPMRARESASRLNETASGDISYAVMLLEDIHNLFRIRKVSTLGSEEILDKLHEMEERPWPEWRDRRPISARQVAVLLHRFGISPIKWRQDTSIVRGYRRDDFSDAFSRYLPPGPPQTPQAPHDSLHSTYADAPSATNGTETAPSSPDKSNGIKGVADVADGQGGAPSKEPPR
ncbi:MAG: DUF3631 domain-containing protein [Acidobacteriota bacterium]